MRIQGLIASLFFSFSCVGTEELPPSGALQLSSPTGLEAESKDGAVTLAWTGVPEAQHYFIYYGSESGGSLSGTEASEGASGFKTTDANAKLSGLKSGVTYFIAVAAGADGKQTSGPSNIVSVTPSTEEEKKIGRELRSVALEIELCVGGRDRVEIQNGKIQIIHEQNNEAPAVSSCPAELQKPAAKVKIDNQDPAQVWDLRFENDKSNQFDLSIEGLLPEEFMSLANLRVIQSNYRASITMNSDGHIIVDDHDNPDYDFDDLHLLGSHPFKFSIEYWHTIGNESGRDIGNVKSAQVALSVCIDGSDTLEVLNGQLQFIHHSYWAAGSHPDCGTSAPVTLTVDKIFDPFAQWALAPWKADSEGKQRSTIFDMKLSGLKSGEFNRIANFKVTRTRSGGGANLSDSNHILFNDNAPVGAYVYSVAFEYWYVTD